MINFHYSDTWADPANQTKPAAWSSYTFDQLMSNVYWHTYNSLTTLKNAGITPKWVQVGNETNNGMLWPEGKASVNMKNFAWLINSGYDAVKAVNSSSKVIVHLANCEDNALYRWMFDGLKANGAKWDVVGASIYPTQTGNGDWFAMDNLCYDNLADMVSRYSKEVMIVEVGMPWDDPKNSYDTIADDHGHAETDTYTLLNLGKEWKLNAANTLHQRLYLGDYRYDGVFPYDYSATAIADPRLMDVDLARGSWWGIENRLVNTQWAGQRITLYLGALAPSSPRPAGENKGGAPQSKESTLAAAPTTAFQFTQEGPVPGFYWTDGGFGYALSGQLSRPDLLALATAVYQQLNP